MAFGITHQQALTLFRLSEPFSLSLLRARWRVLVRLWHPDVRPASDTQALKRFLLIQEAFAVLRPQAGAP
jgi:hypothetical protein